MKTFLLGNKENCVNKSYYWVAVGGLLNAGQSALLLLIISHTNTIEEAGIYSIAYAVASLALTVGNFGMRNFESTDVDEKYSFSVYLSSRIVTDFFMLLMVLFNAIRGFIFLDYSTEKSIVIILIGLMKVVDSLEDVFHGKIQNIGRLDVASKCQATRYFFVILSNAIFLLISHNLVFSFLASFFVSIFYFCFTTHILLKEFSLNIRIGLGNKEVYHLLFECISLFIGPFLLLYIANAPKYAIDQYATEYEQACFNYIFMPVYVVNVLNTIIYQPILTSLAHNYRQNNSKIFLKLFIRQIFVIIVIAMLVIFTGYILGIPVLSFFYNTDLAEFKDAFLYLLYGCGFLALHGFLAAILTIMRRQNYMIMGYGVAALAVFIYEKTIVSMYGIKGASLFYTFINILIFIILGFFFTLFYAKREKN